MTNIELAEKLKKFEDDTLTEEEIKELFQYLYDSKLVWELQGSYGRLTRIFLRMGVVKEKGDEDEEDKVGV